MGFFNLQKKLNKKNSKEKYIFDELMRLIEIRKKQPAFHPNATQYTLSLGKKLMFYGDKVKIKGKVYFQ